MPDYAKLGAEFFARQDEITCQELRLYCLIVFHSYLDKNEIRVCTKTIVEICKIYGLDYDNTNRRFNRLRTGQFSEKETVPKKITPMQSPWLKKDKRGIIPLVGTKNIAETAFEPKKERKKTVKNTGLAGKKITVQTVKNGHNSKFTFEQYLEYAESQKELYNPVGWATNHHPTGDKDILIGRFYSQRNYQNDLESEYDENGNYIVRPMGKEELAEKLEDFQEMIERGIDILESEKFYTKEDWQWLMKELGQVKTATNQG